MTASPAATVSAEPERIELKTDGGGDDERDGARQPLRPTLVRCRRSDGRRVASRSSTTVAIAHAHAPVPDIEESSPGANRTRLGLFLIKSMVDRCTGIDGRGTRRARDDTRGVQMSRQA